MTAWHLFLMVMNRNFLANLRAFSVYFSFNLILNWILQVLKSSEIIIFISVAFSHFEGVVDLYYLDLNLVSVSFSNSDHQLNSIFKCSHDILSFFFLPVCVANDEC